jgi:hypothetical protein
MDRHPPAEDAIVSVSVDESAAELVFPWAVLYPRELPEAPATPDPEGFWGLRYVIEQRIAGHGLRPPAAVPPGATRRFVLGTWSRFANAAEHVRLMRELVARAGPALEFEALESAPKLRQLLTEPPPLDIVYVYGHGHARRLTGDGRANDDREAFWDALPAELKESAAAKALQERLADPEYVPDRTWLHLTTGRLDLSDLDRKIRQLSGTPLVVLNTCESIQMTSSLRQSFAHFFLSRRAQTVIGTECTMTTAFADPFGRRLLEHVLEGVPVGAALLRTRREMLERRNPLGLAYSLYGSAELTLVPPPIAAPSNHQEET